jgi:hypothetical protein
VPSEDSLVPKPAGVRLRARALVVFALSLFVMFGSHAGVAAAGKPSVWDYTASVQAGGFAHAASYHAINSGPDFGFTLMGTVRSSRWPVAFRFEVCYLGGSGAATDSAAMYTYAPPLYSNPKSLDLENTVNAATFGVEWGPPSEKSGAYVFGGVGGLSMLGSGGAEYEDGTLNLNIGGMLSEDPTWAASLGAGARWWIGKKHRHGVLTEAEWLKCGETDYIGTAESATDLPGTHLYTTHGPVGGWAFRAGYVLRIRAKSPE